MAWCHQAPSHYLNQCWPKSVILNLFQVMLAGQHGLLLVASMGSTGGLMCPSGFVPLHSSSSCVSSSAVVPGANVRWGCVVTAVDWQLLPQCQVGAVMLTYWHLNWMAGILQMILLKAFSWLKIFVFSFSLKFVPWSPIKNNSALVEVMAWCQKATSHYLNQWCLLKQYGIARPLKLS